MRAKHYRRATHAAPRLTLARVARALLAACALTACDAVDAGLIAPIPDGGAPQTDAGGRDGAASGHSGGGAGGALAGGGGLGGAAGDPLAGSGGTGPDRRCEPAPADAPVGCVEICPERCNGLDDDCNGLIDDGDADALCQLDNALAACVAGECFISECTNGFRDCDGDAMTGCETPLDDVQHCGMCRRVCSIPGAVEACIDGECAAVGCEDDSLGDCDDESPDCETTLTNSEHCGGCGVACDALPNAARVSCATGVCTPVSCALGFDNCNTTAADGCEQALDTLDHCDACNTACDLEGSSGDDCDEQVCRAGPCDDGYGDCDGDRLNGCEPLNTTEHCGSCGQGCGGEDFENIEGASCASGRCMPACRLGFADCDDDPFNGCESSVRTTSRCGDCDTRCELANAEASCDEGTCAIRVCNPGWLDCNGRPDDGCETSANDDDTCGRCDNACAPPDPVCSGGVCGDVVCPTPGTADCAQDGLPCEVDLRTDVRHCGACNAPCEFTVSQPRATALTCAASRCEVNCEAGYADCNGDYRDGCETALNTLTNCGACDVACAIPNAGESCATGECLVTQCAPDFRDCDGDRRSCERAVNTVSDCGACNAACELSNALPACGGSAGARACAVSSCVQFFANCDGNAANGCEVSLQTDARNCGACRYDCTAEENVTGATCSGGSCNFTCAAGFRDCNNVDDDGCERSIRTLTDCGACDVACVRANGTASCASGSCELVACASGFDECDGNDVNGCESLRTVSNCGACGAACLPPNASGDCGGGSCAIGSCNAGWADCDSDPQNGCERNVAMLGPCLPDAGCVRSTFGGGEYYLCGTTRTWSEARARCRTQLYGDLVRIDSASENTFVHGLVGSRDVWIGATDADPISIEGQWRWANDTALFWTGLADGTLASGMYARWNMGEPNQYMGTEEDCGELLGASGMWNDRACSASRAFVCEVAGDLCPMDPNKTAPGQCGCGVADIDTDGDRTMDCIDGCPMDASKTSPGACGCGVADTDSDGDGTPNCNDGCPSDPSKTAPLQCGCGNPETDSDGDGTADCVDECPADALRVAPPCGYPYDPTHYDDAALDFVSAPSTSLSCGASVTIDTSGPVTLTGWCGAAPTPVIVPQAGGPELVVLPLRGLTIAASTTVRVIGSRPLVLAVNGDASIAGAINARGAGATPGAGGNVSCGEPAIGDDGGHDSRSDRGSAGGSGGAFATAGGASGGGNNGWGGALASVPEGNANLVPLRGGCQGGMGGGAGGGRQGGGGGGAVAISVSGSLTVSGSAARVSASGGGGRRGSNDEDGGGGGGSGGSVFLEASVLDITGGWVTANGGGGASGNSTSSANGEHGSDGLDSGGGTTAGGRGSDGGGDGGVGAGASTGAGNGRAGQTFFFFISGAGGGGGGGGRGRVHYRGVSSCNLGGSSSPSATRAGVCL